MKPEESREWQSPLLTLRERGSQLLKLGLWTDCVFLVGPDQNRIAAHKLFLAISSPVFEAMFFGGMAEGNEPIPTPDVQPEAFRTLLKYVYTEDVIISSFEDACDVFYAAKKYMMTGLINQCQTHLLSKVTTSNVCHALELASMFDDNALLEVCKVILSKQTSTVLAQKGFLEAHPSTLVKICSLDRLNIKDELDLLIAIEKYVEARGLKRSMIDGEPDAKKARYDESLSSETSLETTTEETTDSDVLDEEDMKTLQRAVKQIRLLTVPVVELALHAPHCVALPRRDALSLLLHALSDSMPPPSGYCLRTDVRLLQPPKPIEENQPDQKAEVSIQLTVLNFKTRKRRVQSETQYLHDVAWCVQVVPGDYVPKTLGLFVKCGLNKTQASCKADVTIKLKGVPPKNNHKIKKFSQIFNRDVDTQGYASFATWSEACDTGLYSHGNTVVVEVHIAAYRPVC